MPRNQRRHAPQAFLGHKRSDNSDLFTQIEQRSFQDIGDPSKYCTTSKEVIRLGERLIRPFGIIEGVHLYRKRK